MGIVKVTIYHGYEEDGRMVFGLGDESAMPSIVVEAYSYETDRDGTDPEVIFRRNNAVDGSEYNVLNQARSLSVGDVVKVASAFYKPTFHLVESVGFSAMLSQDFDKIPQVTKENVRERQNALNQQARKEEK